MDGDRNPGPRDDEPEVEEYEDEAPRSIFTALWFRAVLAVLILGVLAAIIVPYVLDIATRSASDNLPAKQSAPAPSPVSTTPTARPVDPPQPTASAPTAAPMATSPQTAV